LLIISLLPHSLPPLLCQTVRLGDVSLLAGLVASAQQQDHHAALLDEVDPVAGADIEGKFPHPVADGLDVAATASREAVYATQDPQATGPVLQFLDPRIEIVSPDNLDHVSTISDRVVSVDANPRSSDPPPRDVRTRRLQFP
jgi:hypothetical protein